MHSAPGRGRYARESLSAVCHRFAGYPDAIELPRADLEPRCVDLIVNITDALQAVNAFMGLPYPLETSAADPCLSTCVAP